MNKHYDIVKYLLLKEDKNIHINHCDRNGDTCLHKACKLAYDNSTNPAKHHRLAIAMLLIEHGGNIYACNEVIHVSLIMMRACRVYIAKDTIP